MCTQRSSVAGALVEAAPHSVTASNPDGVSVNELMLAYLRHAQGYYRKDGKPTSEVRNIGLGMRVEGGVAYGVTAVATVSVAGVWGVSLTVKLIVGRHFASP